MSEQPLATDTFTDELDPLVIEFANGVRVSLNVAPSTRTKSVGFSSTTPTMRSAQSPARSRSRRVDAIRTATRRKFSISASRSISGSAHNSPSLSGATD